VKVVEHGGVPRNGEKLQHATRTRQSAICQLNHIQRAQILQKFRTL
jgi:hypothetical protein